MLKNWIGQFILQHVYHCVVMLRALESYSMLQVLGSKLNEQMKSFLLRLKFIVLLYLFLVRAPSAISSLWLKISDKPIEIA